jgi:hypothetical protein
MRPFEFTFGCALLAITVGCYGTPRRTSPEDDAGVGGGGTGGGAGAGGTGGALEGRGGFGGTSGTGGASGTAGVSGMGGAGTAPCQQCSPGGTCQMPADDRACGTITCPTDSTCRDYGSGISTNRCKALGQCKTAADCAYVDAPPTTVCGYVRGMSEIAPAKCDGMGNCRAPTVKCGGDGECAVDQSWCCGRTSGLTCQADECAGAPKLGPYLCDEQADCAPGYVCCLQSTPGGPSALCLTPALCASDAASSRAYACNPAVPAECPVSTTCQPASSGPIGWYVCR